MNIITYKLPYLTAILQQMGLKVTLAQSFEAIKSEENSLLILEKAEDSQKIASHYKLLIETKPIKAAELLTKINGFEPNIFITDSITFNPKTQLIIAGGRQEELTDKESSVLLYLYNNRGQIISKSDLLRQVWNHKEELDTKTLEAHIYRIRSKLGEFKDLIQAKDGGYSMI